MNVAEDDVIDEFATAAVDAAETLVFGDVDGQVPATWRNPNTGTHLRTLTGHPIDAEQSTSPTS